MGKKVKIPINKEGSSLEEEALETNEAFDETQQEEQLEASTNEGEEEPGSNGKAKGPFGLDDSFLDRDVDFGEIEADFEMDADDIAKAERDLAGSGNSNPDAANASKLQAELDDYKQKYLRALADLENFRKRSQKERTDLLKYQGEKILIDIVDVLDNLELALQHKDAEIENLRTGVQMIHQQFIDVLDRWGVRSESALGKKFDPNRQNALNKVPSEDAEPGSVVAEFKKAYVYKDKLLRVGEVVVAEAPEGAEN